MKRFIVFILLTVFGQYVYGQDSLLVVFWNVENFFDYVDGVTGESDREFSSMGPRHWTKKRFQAKCDAIAKSILWIGDCQGRMPDVIGLAEIENRNVLRKLLDNTVLRKYDYQIVHYDSDDRRGIDVALLYRESVLRRSSHSLKSLYHEGVRIPTRDMLHVCLENGIGQNINMIVCHHPSKYGGSSESSGRRISAMIALKELCDSLYIDDPDIPIVAMGDFNDTPDGEQFNILEGTLNNKADDLFNSGKGTIRYQGKWELIDMFMVSEEISEKSVMNIIQIPFLMTHERKYPGLRPLRTYSGPRYVGGVSDHCPIILCIFQ